MAKSEILELYAKLAAEKGLISSAEEDAASPAASKDSPKLKRYKKSPYPRAGSDDISTIEALYGVKPESTNKYEFNIMEAAHPKPVVIGPAYDRMNALVENEIERQNISINITQKPTDGNLTNKRYASKELMFELVRLANDLDNAGRDELRKLADDCIGGLNFASNGPGLKKKAFDVGDAWGKVKNFFGDEVENVSNMAKGLGAGATLGLIAGSIIGTFVEPGGGTLLGARIGATLGAESGVIVAFFGKTPPIVQSVAQNAKETSEKIEALKKHIPDGNQEASFLTGFQTQLEALADVSNRFNQTLATVKSNPDAVKSEDHAISISKDLSSELDRQIKSVSEMVNLFNSKVNSNVYKQFVSPSKLMQYTVYRFIDDATDDVVNSVKALMESIKQFDAVMGKLHVEMKNQSGNAESETGAEKDSPNEEYAPEKANEDADYGDIVETIGHEPSEREMEFFKSLK